MEDVLKRVEENCDYIGLGPFRFTATKEKLSPVLGLGGYEFIMNEIAREKIRIPVYAIGGIRLEDLVDIMNTGVYGVAVSGSITNHPDKKEWVQKMQLFGSAFRGLNLPQITQISTDFVHRLK